MKTYKFVKSTSLTTHDWWERNDEQWLNFEKKLRDGLREQLKKGRTDAGGNFENSQRGEVDKVRFVEKDYISACQGLETYLNFMRRNFEKRAIEEE